MTLTPTLSSTDYCSPDVFEVERRRIFHAGWMYVCHVDGIPAGTRRAFDIAGESVVVTQLIGHVTFTLSFVVVIIRSRLAAIGTQFEEAARDLGATRLQSLRMVLLPQRGPAIFASLMVTFARSVDDFVISSFLSTGAGTETVPIKIYSGARTGSTPALNALATVMLLFTLVAVALAGLVMRRVRHQTPVDPNAGIASIVV